MKIHVVNYKYDGAKGRKGFANVKAANTFKSHLKRGLIEQYDKSQLKVNKEINTIDIPITAKGLIEAINY
jgi:hypothetical protein|tara:strand:- start:104 stop:313 length:210 start_codon:yes stop_codon:yes gene_type:complete